MGRTFNQSVREPFGELALDALTDALAGRLAQQQPGKLRGKTTGLPGTPSQNFLHGPGSLFGTLGLSPEVFNAMILPRKGVQAELPYFRNPFENEIVEILTGQTAGTGTEPTAACQDATQPGQLKICKQMWPYGQLVKDTQVLDITKSGRLINRGEFVDMRVVGNPWEPLTQSQNPP